MTGKSLEEIIDVIENFFSAKSMQLEKNMFGGDALKRRIIFFHLNIYISYRNHFLKLCMPHLTFIFCQLYGGTFKQFMAKRDPQYSRLFYRISKSNMLNVSRKHGERSLRLPKHDATLKCLLAMPYDIFANRNENSTSGSAKCSAY